MPMIEQDAPLSKAFNAVRDYPWKEKARRLIYDTPIEVAIGALLVGSLLGGGSFYLQRGNEGQIPVAFSEIGQTVRSYESQGLPVPPLTKFYASGNDFTMQIFEASNNAFEVSRSDEDFARQLEIKMYPELKIHKQIPEYAGEIPVDAQNALTALDKLTAAERDLPVLLNALQNVWSESHHDVTHTRTWTTEDCDSEGHCTTQWHSEEVYDYTNHTYEYHEEAGEHAARMLHDFIERHPDLHIAERLQLATSVGRDNLEAIAKSMKELLKGNMPTNEQALEFANTWATGSNFTSNMPTVLGGHAGVQRETGLWDEAKATAESQKYRTYHHSDAGPEEYQVIDRAINGAAAALNASREITNGIRYMSGQANALQTQAQEFIDVAQGEKEGNPGKLRASLMEAARDMYDANFKRGFDVRPFKAWVVAIWAVAGTVLGGLIGFATDRFVDSQKYYWERARREREERKRRQGNNPLETKPSRLDNLRKKLSGLFASKAKPEDVTKFPEEKPRLREIEELRDVLTPKTQPAVANENADKIKQAEKPAPVAEEEPAPEVPAVETEKKPVNDDRPKPKQQQIDPNLRKGFGL